MSAVPRWALLSAGGAPLFLVGGWTLAQAAQPDGFDPVRQTISALAATGADHRWIMTIGLAGLGLCHLTTALGLVSAAPAGRALLALGGLATLVLVAFPQNPAVTRPRTPWPPVWRSGRWPSGRPGGARSGDAVPDREHRHPSDGGRDPVRRVALGGGAPPRAGRLVRRRALHRRDMDRADRAAGGGCRGGRTAGRRAGLPATAESVRPG
ncbi:DUF998 domain-containing protein [Micromonospora sp. M12]